MATIHRPQNPNQFSLKLLHTVITADDTPPPAAHTTLSSRILLGSTILHEFADVSQYDAIRCYFFGTDAANETITITFSGMYQFGTLQLMSTHISAVLSSNASLAFADINGPGFMQGQVGVEQAVFDEVVTKHLTTDFLMVDDYVATAGDEAGAALAYVQRHASGLAQGIGHIDIDLSYTRYDYIQTSIELGTAASAGAVYHPLRMRDPGRMNTSRG